MAVQKQDDQHEHTFSSYVRIRDVVLKTYLGRWTIGRSGERGSGISVLPARYDDDDDDDDDDDLFILRWSTMPSPSIQQILLVASAALWPSSNLLRISSRIRLCWTLISTAFKSRTEWSNAHCVSAPTTMILLTTMDTCHGMYYCPWCNGYRCSKWTRRHFT